MEFDVSTELHRSFSRTESLLDTMALSVKYLTSSLLVIELESVRIFLDVQVWLQFLDVKGLADLPTKVRFVSTPDDFEVRQEYSFVLRFL